jgi:hypothetical protein
LPAQAGGSRLLFVADSNNASKASSGIGLGGIVFVVFLVLKLAEIGVVATWSWWWVTAPLWMPIGLVVAIIATMGVFALVMGAIGAIVKGLR